VTSSSTTEVPRLPYEGRGAPRRLHRIAHDRLGRDHAGVARVEGARVRAVPNAVAVAVDAHGPREVAAADVVRDHAYGVHGVPVVGVRPRSGRLEVDVADRPPDPVTVAVQTDDVADAVLETRDVLPCHRDGGGAGRVGRLGPGCVLGVNPGDHDVAALIPAGDAGKKLDDVDRNTRHGPDGHDAVGLVLGDALAGRVADEPRVTGDRGAVHARTLDAGLDAVAGVAVVAGDARRTGVEALGRIRAPAVQAIDGAVAVVVDAVGAVPHEVAFGDQHAHVVDAVLAVVAGAVRGALALGGLALGGLGAVSVQAVDGAVGIVVEAVGAVLLEGPTVAPLDALVVADLAGPNAGLQEGAGAAEDVLGRQAHGALEATAILAIAVRAARRAVARRRGRGLGREAIHVDLAAPFIEDAAGAGAVHTGVLLGAGAPVVTGRHVVGVQAARVRVARIVRAGVLVVAADRRATAHARGADVSAGAGAPVVARRGVVGEDAARAGVARIVRAGVLVVAADRRAADANTVDTSVVLGARAAVVARLGVGRVHATGRRVAPVVRAGVLVVAGQHGAGGADALRGAAVAAGARVPVVTRSADHHRGSDAAEVLTGMRRIGGLARVDRAGVAVDAVAVVEALVRRSVQVNADDLGPRLLERGGVQLTGASPGQGEQDGAERRDGLRHG